MPIKLQYPFESRIAFSKPVRSRKLHTTFEKFLLISNTTQIWDLTTTENKDVLHIKMLEINTIFCFPDETSNT